MRAQTLLYGFLLRVRSLKEKGPMRHWTFWEWLAYACLLVGAVIIAADTGLRLAPDLAAKLPDLAHEPAWGFAPLSLMLLATAVLAARAFGWVG